MKIQLTRPLVFFDLETTGVNIAKDRIVELSYYKVFPNGTKEGKTYRVRPTIIDALGLETTMHIPEQASAVHGIYDEDVKDCPTFIQIAQEVASVFEGADIAGYNSNHFDVPLLGEEFLRAGLAFDIADRNMIDVFTIFTRKEQRTLSAAYAFYCGKDLTDAHSANADTMATYEVLLAQAERYEDLPQTVEGLAQYSAPSQRFADLAGKLSYNANGEVVFAFGKYKDVPVSEVLVKGDSVFKGYRNRPDLNAEIFTEDGFFKTGDQGYFDRDGYLYLTGRLKELLKTSTGKYVSPNPIELELGRHLLIEQALVIANDRKFASALLFLNPVNAKRFLKRVGNNFNLEKALKSRRIRESINRHVERVNSKLNHWEQIRHWTLIGDELTVESGLLTPTLKIRRSVAEARFAEEIEKMYEETSN